MPRAGAISDTRGVIKMVLDGPTRRVVGVSMLVVNAGEVIHEAAMALAAPPDRRCRPTMMEAEPRGATRFPERNRRNDCDDNNR